MLSYTEERGIATITLDSPHNRNALSAQLVSELESRLDAVAADDGVRAAVLTHTGNTFCSGADLSEAPEQGTGRLMVLLRRILELPKPVVAVLDGHVRAGGLGLLGACDIVLAGPRSTFAFSEARLGLAPAVISLTTLPRLSDRAAGRYFLTGEVFDARRAVEIGLLTRAVPAGELDATVAHYADMLRRGGPEALAITKRLVRTVPTLSFAEGLREMSRLSAERFTSPEGQEGIRAFREKRDPAWY